MEAKHPPDIPLAALSPEQRKEAMTRFSLLQAHIEGEIPLSQVARNASIPVRTVQRWLARYNAFGLIGLIRSRRSDAGSRKLPPEFIALIEGMALRKPRLSVATIHRRITTIAKERQWPPPSYGCVYSIIRNLPPGMITLAHEGHAAFRDGFELVYRHRAERPNAIWQADHTQLDMLVLDANGSAVRPWLTVVMDDYSRAVAGYMVFAGTPSSLQTSLALRQAIWRKTHPSWMVYGIPDILYVDHGSDFTSAHLEQAAADLRFQIIYSTVGRPQGRGKVERLFGTLNTELLPELPGHLTGGTISRAPKLSLPELDAAIGEYMVERYNSRLHKGIGTSPNLAWTGDGWLPRVPDSLEDLDLLLVMVAKSRMIRRDGIRFQGLRYLEPTLATYVGESVTIRYDPRDISEIRVFHQNRFLCKAVSPEHSGQTITLKDIQTARARHRRSLYDYIHERRTRITDFLPDPPKNRVSSQKTIPDPPSLMQGLLTYFEDKL